MNSNQAEYAAPDGAWEFSVERFLQRCRADGATRRLLEEAESQARTLDDNHVGTKHIVLAIYALGTRVTTKALESLGVTRVVCH